MSDEDVLHELTRLLDSATHELDRADTKASVLFSAIGVGVGAFLAALLAQNWTPSRLPLPSEILWWLGAIAAATALVILGLSAYPRISSNAGADSLLTFFAEVAPLQHEQLISALKDTAQRKIEARARLLSQVSRLVVRKYRFIALGVRLLGGAVILIFLSLLFSH